MGQYVFSIVKELLPMSINHMPMLTGVGSPSEFGRDLVISVGTEPFELSANRTGSYLTYLE